MGIGASGNTGFEGNDNSDFDLDDTSESLQDSIVMRQAFSNLGAIVPKSGKDMTPDMMKLLTKDEISKLSKSFLKGLKTNVIEVITAEQASGFKDFQFAAFSNEQVGAFGAKTLSGLSEAVGMKMTAADIKAIKEDAIQGLSTQAFRGLRPAVIKEISGAQAMSLNKAQIESIAFKNLASLSKDALTKLSFDAAQGFTAESIVYLTDVQAGQLGSEAIKGLSSQAVGGFTAKQLGKLTASQGQAFTASQIAAINLDNIASLSKELLSGLNKDAAAGFDALDIDRMTTTQVAAFGGQMIQGLTAGAIASLDKAQIEALTPTQAGFIGEREFNAFTDAQLGFLTQSLLQNMTKEAARAISASDVDSLRPAQIAWFGQTAFQNLDSTALGSLNADQLAALTTTEATWLTKAQVAALDPSQLAAGLKMSVLQNLTADAVSGFDVAQVKALSGTQIAQITQITSLSESAWQALNAAQLECLTQTQMDTLTAEDIAAFTDAQIQYLPGAFLSKMDRDLGAALSETDILLLSPAQIAQLAPDAISGLSKAAILMLNAEQLAALTMDQAHALTKDQVDWLDYDHLMMMKPWVFGSLSKSGASGLTADDMAHLRDEFIAAMKSEALSGLTADAGTAITENHMRIWGADMNAWGQSQISWISTDAFNKISPDAIDAVPYGQTFAFTALQLAVIRPDQISRLGFLEVMTLNPLALVGLNPVAAFFISPLAAQALTPTQMFFLSPLAFMGFNPNTILELRSDQLGGYGSSSAATYMKNLISSKPSGLFGQAVDQSILDATWSRTGEAINDVIKVGSIFNGIYNGLKTAWSGDATIQDILNSMTYGASKFIAEARDGGLSFMHMVAMPITTAQLLTPKQWAAIDPDAIDGLQYNVAFAIKGINAQDIAAMSVEQIRHFPEGKIDNLTLEAVSGFSRAHLAGMKDGQLVKLTGEQIEHLTPDAVKGLGKAQLSLMSNDQLSHFTPGQLEGMSVEQVSAFGKIGYAIPAEAQPLRDIASLDVTSPLVVKFNSNIKLGTGTIKIMDDKNQDGMIFTRSSDGKKFQDTYDNDITFTLVNGKVEKIMIGNDLVSGVADGSSVIVKDNMLVIRPKVFHSNGGKSSGLDLDFGSRYHVEIGTGVVKDAVSDKPNIGSTFIHFETVKPTKDGSYSDRFDDAGNKVPSTIWHDAHNLSSTTKEDADKNVPIHDFGTGKHALVIQTEGGTTASAKLGGRAMLTNFGPDDLIYQDNLGNINMQTTEADSGLAAASGTWGGKYFAANGSLPNAYVGLRSLSTDDSAHIGMNVSIFPDGKYLAPFETTKLYLGTAKWTDQSFENLYQQNSITFG